jgi:hypothetical protein
MKRFMRGIATLGLTLISSVVFLGGPSAGAQQLTCSIYNSGSSAYNSCTQNSDQYISVVCDNNVYVVNNNAQNAGTGVAGTTGNGSSGSATSGNALNENNQVVNLGAACGTTTTSTTPTTPSTPPSGSSSSSTPATGGVGAATPAATTTSRPAPAALPYTASNPIATIAMISLAALATILIATRIGIMAYRRVTIK